MTDTATVDETDHAAHAGHPVDRHYVNIAIALAVITGLEVAVAYIGLDTVPEIGILMVLMGIKFSMVASQFMHLKFDNKILRRLFVGGLLLAVAVYLAYLFSMGVFIEKPEDRNHAPQNQAWAAVRAS
jgi:cytochrome c oxidase subunit IV